MTDSRAPGELTARELLRYGWRQLTSMRTALVLLLLLAVAAIPGSIIPQESQDSQKTSLWQQAHPTLTPIYERLGLFAVYDTPWFAAIYLLLMVSLVGCIVPRLFVYWRAWRKPPPRTPELLERLRDHAVFVTDATPEEVLARAEAALGGYRRKAYDDSLAGERGHLREAGNLLFHLALLIVLVGFAMGSLFGYRGGVIVGVGQTFSNNLTQYDDLEPGSLFDASAMEPFCFTVEGFNAEWTYTGRQIGMARKFVAPISYRENCQDQGTDQAYDLRVNHPLKIGGTEVFLVGFGYAPVLTIRDGNGDIAYRGPVTFLPTNPQTMESFGVVKVPDARPTQLALQGGFYPTEERDSTEMPYSTFGELIDPGISLTVWTGDVGLDTGQAQSVYALDTSRMQQVPLAKNSPRPFLVNLKPGESVDLPDGLGSVSFDDVDTWVRVQVSRTPGIYVALSGAVLALIGLMLSLFVRPRRVWVRARRTEQGTLVEVAALDRSSGGDVGEEIARIVAELPGPSERDVEV